MRSTGIESNVYQTFEFEDSTRRTRTVANIPLSEEEIHAGLFLANQRDRDGLLKINPAIITWGRLDDYLLPGEENSSFVKRKFSEESAKRERGSQSAASVSSTVPRRRRVHNFNPRFNVHMHANKNVHVLNHKKLRDQQEEWERMRAPLERDSYAERTEWENCTYDEQQHLYLSDPDRLLNSYDVPSNRVTYAVPMAHPRIAIPEPVSDLQPVRSAHEQAEVLRNEPFERQRRNEEKVRQFQRSVQQRVAAREAEKRMRIQISQREAIEQYGVGRALAQRGPGDKEASNWSNVVNIDQESEFEQQRILKMRAHTYSQDVAARNRKLLSKVPHRLQIDDQELKSIQKQQQQQQQQQRHTAAMSHSPPTRKWECYPHNEQTNEDEETCSSLTNAESSADSTEPGEYTTSPAHPELMHIHMIPQKRTVRKIARGTTEEERRQIEARRYLDALKAQVMGKCQELDIQIPALCNCGTGTFDDRAHCHVNCQFYNDAPSYARALRGILYCYGIDVSKMGH